MTTIEIQTLLKQELKHSGVFSTKQIAEILNSKFPELSPNTISWKINQLKSEELIFQCGRGIYTFEHKPDFEVELSSKAKRLHNRVLSEIDYTLCVWDTEIIERIIGRKLDKNWVFIAASKDNIDDLFDTMLDFSKKMFIEDDRNAIKRYLLPQEDAIILSRLISEAPIQQIKGYTVPSLEMILVNSWMTKDLLFDPIGLDVKEVFQKSFEKYNISYTKLLRYASRRDKRGELEKLIKEI